MIDSLAVNGKLVIPIGPTDSPQHLTLVIKTQDEKITYRKLIDVLYVPLTSYECQIARDENWDSVVEDCHNNSDAYFEEQEEDTSIWQRFKQLFW